MLSEISNCDRCYEKEENRCDGSVDDCICKKCPRNLGQCLTTRYCRETESIIFYEDEY
ncbi:hypothetical protein [Clostridium cellulovorans]|uniref:Uncharacterized protein n=1 Tax=Clostridium cellulovorans (strain ATCC 35296 / DSM 3052 / OCM 3 / 743B) TaxID=573061 RepID=D9SMR6_CLOC7|nr:hypothetical protein [Clostridium cellulovorans]ADL49851.1 hypothetical protein Clocel_0062 [Clostridium cellulovorans 743B]